MVGKLTLLTSTRQGILPHVCDISMAFPLPQSSSNEEIVNLLHPMEHFIDLLPSPPTAAESEGGASSEGGNPQYVEIHSLANYIGLAPTLPPPVQQQAAQSKKKNSDGVSTHDTKRSPYSHILSTFEPRRSKAVGKSFLETSSLWPTGNNSCLGMIANGGNRLLVSPAMVVDSCTLLKPDLLILGDPNRRLYKYIHSIHSIPAGRDHITKDTLLYSPSSSSQERKAHTRWISFLEGVMTSLPEKFKNSTSSEGSSSHVKKGSLPKIWICIGGSKKDGIKHSALHIKEEYEGRVQGWGIVLPIRGILEAIDWSNKNWKETLAAGGEAVQKKQKRSEEDESLGEERRIWLENLTEFSSTLKGEDSKEIEGLDVKTLYLSGVGSFKDIVQAVSLGVTVFDDSWIESISLHGLALFANFGDSKQGAANGGEVMLKNEAKCSPEATREFEERIHYSDKGRTLVYDLRPVGKRNEGRGTEASLVRPLDLYKAHTKPLSSLCGCWTCSNGHTVAYIHHLLCVNDMLAFTMLQLHNTWTIRTFVKEVEASLKDGSFEAKAKIYL